MVLCLKTRESRSLPGLPSAKILFHEQLKKSRRRIYAGWSSPVARQAHNLKVVGSNPAPATNSKSRSRKGTAFCCLLLWWHRDVVDVHTPYVFGAEPGSTRQPAPRSMICVGGE